MTAKSADSVRADDAASCPQTPVTGHEDDSPQEVTYLESLLEGANPDEGFYE